VVVSARLGEHAGMGCFLLWFAQPCFIEFFKELLCVLLGFMLCRVAGAVAMLSIFKNGPTKATRMLGVGFNLNCEVGSFGHGYLSARACRRGFVSHCLGGNFQASPVAP
jgi:hypothetical protein